MPEGNKVPTSYLVGTILQYILLGILWGVLATVFYVKMSNDLGSGNIPEYGRHQMCWKRCLWIGVIVQIVAIIIIVVAGGTTQ